MFTQCPRRRDPTAPSQTKRRFLREPASAHNGNLGLCSAPLLWLVNWFRLIALLALLAPLLLFLLPASALPILLALLIGLGADLGSPL